MADKTLGMFYNAINDVETKQDAIDAKLSDILTELQAIDDRVASIETDTSAIRTDISDINVDIDNIKDNIQDVVDNGVKDKNVIYILSTETKPDASSVEKGKELFEVDTGKYYMSDGSAWVRK